MDLESKDDNDIMNETQPTAQFHPLAYDTIEASIEPPVQVIEDDEVVPDIDTSQESCDSEKDDLNNQENDNNDNNDNNHNEEITSIVDVSDASISSVASESSILDERNVNGYDYLLKFIVVGNSCVGKSNLTLRFTRDDFEMENETTIGVEFATKVVCLDSKVYKLQIWDTAGQDTFKTITRGYYRNSIGCIVAYDITNRESFDAVRQWVEELVERSHPYTGKQSIVIVGNKMDKTNKRAVSYAEGESLATELGYKFYEASAKTGENVNEIFCNIVADINHRISNDELNLRQGNGGTIKLTGMSDSSYGSYCGC
jgi:small GTP-binding protein